MVLFLLEDPTVIALFWALINNIGIKSDKSALRLGVIVWRMSQQLSLEICCHMQDLVNPAITQTQRATRSMSNIDST